MLKTVENLLKANSNKKIGSHRVINKMEAGVKEFTYYNTCICKVDYNNRIVIIDNGGYNTSSTTRAINDYINYFKDSFKIIDNRL